MAPKTTTKSPENANPFAFNQVTQEQLDCWNNRVPCGFPFTIKGQNPKRYYVGLWDASDNPDGTFSELARVPDGGNEGQYLISDGQGGWEWDESNFAPVIGSISDGQGADIRDTATDVLIAGDTFQNVGASYPYTHERQFTDSDGNFWVDVDYLKKNDRMPIVIINTGQSNSLGVSGGDGGDIASQPCVWSYERHPTGTQSTGWKLGFKESPDYVTGQSGNHFIYHFAARMQRETNRPICVINYSIGGQDVAEWLPAGGGVNGATGTMWANLLSAWNQAQSIGLPFRTDGKTLSDLGLTTADFLIWHQGEENRDATATYGADEDTNFKRDLIRVMNAFLNPASAASGSAPLIRQDTPIVMGDLAYGGAGGVDDRNPELYQVASEVDGISIAEIGNVPTVDGVHFDPNHIERIADFYYNKINSEPRSRGWVVNIPAGGFYQFRPSHVSGRYAITETNGASRLHVEFGYRVSAVGGQVTTADVSPTFNLEIFDDVDLSVLNNATNGALAISAIHKFIQIRNRRANDLEFRIQCLTPQPLPGFGVV